MRHSLDLDEEIDYNLTIFGDETQDDIRFRRLIVEVLKRLPADVRRRVLEEAIFIVAGHTIGLSTPFYPLPIFGEDEEQLKEELRSLMERWPLRSLLKKRLIILNFALMEREGYSEEDMKAAIAHEIAHLALDHDFQKRGDYEKEADDLCEKWGFKRAYGKRKAAPSRG